MQATIGTQSMICALEFGLPRQSRQLKEEASKIEEDKKAQKGAVRAPSANYFKLPPKVGQKEQIDGLKVLKDLQKEYKERVHMLARYPYAGGFYLAPAPVVADLLKLEQMYETGTEGQPSKMSEAWVKWSTEVYPDLLESAPDRMGTMFSKDDFPSLAECKKKFRAHITILPLAEKDQVARITLISPSHQSLLKMHADKAQTDAIAGLKKQIWQDLMAPLQKIVETFSKDKSKVHACLLENLMSVVNVIPAYKDLFEDPNLLKAAEQVKKVFGEMTTEDLKKSDQAKKTALAAATTMVSQFDPFARAFADDE